MTARWAAASESSAVISSVMPRSSLHFSAMALRFDTPVPNWRSVMFDLRPDHREAGDGARAGGEAGGRRRALQHRAARDAFLLHVRHRSLLPVGAAALRPRRRARGCRPGPMDDRRGFAGGERAARRRRARARRRSARRRRRRSRLTSDRACPGIRRRGRSTAPARRRPLPARHRAVARSVRTLTMRPSDRR